LTDQVVLDASAVLAWRDGDARAVDLVDPVLDGSLLSAVNGAEVRYRAAETGDDPDGLIADLVALGVQLVAFDDAQARHLPELRAIDRAARQTRGRSATSGRLSLADLCCLGLAVTRDATVITGDAHWSRLIQHGLPVQVVDYRAER
jgi:ribonuclease VapC